jgi:predicted esterase
MLDEMRQIPGASTWRLVSVQALHPFYTRNDQAVVASWMTRQDRELAIADNVEYLKKVVGAVAEPSQRIVFIGFSQGAAMAARAAVRPTPRASGLILLGGDIPPDVREDASLRWPPVLIGVGDRDSWYGARVESDVEFLKSRNIPHQVVRFAGGHEFTEEFRRAAGAWLAFC